MHQDKGALLDQVDHLDHQEALAFQESQDKKVKQGMTENLDHRVKKEDWVVKVVQENRAQKETQEKLDFLVQEAHQYVNCWSKNMLYFTFLGC